MAEFNLADCVGGANDFSYTINDTGTSTPWVSGPAKIVTDHVSIAHNYAAQAFDNTWCFLEGLANYAPTLNDVSSNVSFDEITTPTPTINLPDAPTAPVIDIVVPAFPDSFVPGDLYQFDENAIGTVPTFSEPAPTVNLPGLPGAFDETAPTDAPTITSDFNFPDSPDSVLPTVPTFTELNLPDAPVIDIPSFELDIPTPPVDLTPPGLTFSFEEEDYSSVLMDALSAELLDRIQNGGTGLNADVEQAIWDRARNREDQNAIRSENQINVEQASRGFSRPSGAHLAALDQLAQETQNKNADLSREIAIKQAELEQENIKFALQTTLALEQTYLQNWNQVQQRAFETEKYMQQAAIEIYDARIKAFSLQVDIYKAYSQSFEARVRAELAKAEVYKTEIDAQKLIGEINLQYVELYKAQLDGIKTAVDIYTSEVGAIKVQIEAEALEIQNFKALVDVFSAQVQAKTAEYDMYASAVKGEMAKVDIFDSQVKSFVSRVDAYSKQADVEISRVNSDIEVEGLRLKEHLAKLSAIVQQVQTEAAVATAQTDAFKAEAAGYTAVVGAESTRLDAESKVYDLEVQKARYSAEVDLKNASINIENAANSVKLIIESLKSGAQVGSSLSAASLSAMNIGASISGSSSDQHIYQEK